MPAKVILSMDGLVLKEFNLTKERTSIGRKPHNDVHIDNLAVSGDHAVIVTILNDSFLEDLGSTNGTFVNGVPVQKHFLQNGDVIEIGKYKMKYVNEQVGKGEGADFEKTMVLRAPAAAKPVAAAPQAPGAPAAPAATAPAAPAQKGFGDTQTGLPPQTPPGMPAAPKPAAQPAPAPAAAPRPAAQPAPIQPAAPRPAAAPAAQPAAAQQPLAAIQILSGPSAGKELELVKTLTTLGKPGVQVAVIAKRPHGYFITHVEGASLPVINGQSLDPHPHQLNDHDIIELAGVKMEFFFKT
ncbi:MAG: FHA domain-containing protein [Betaproteobacteria bacterium]|nr:FHA domain-containing protein [Betaproteobacteria bacterium]